MIQLVAALAGAGVLAYALTQGALSLAYALDDVLARRRMPAPDPLTRVDVVALAGARQRLTLNHASSLNERIKVS